MNIISIYLKLFQRTGDQGLVKEKHDMLLAPSNSIKAKEWTQTKIQQNQAMRNTMAWTILQPKK